MARSTQLFKVEGLKDLEKALKELPRATGKSVLKRFLLKRAKPIAEDAGRRAPKLSGELGASHTAGTKLSARQARKHVKESTVEVFAGPAPLAKAIAQEFGNVHNRAQPYMRPAWDAGKMQALEGMTKDLADEIETARERLAKKAERLAAKIKSGA